jgi:hypothetical protein
VTDRLRSLVEHFLSSVGVVNGSHNDSLLATLKKSTFVTKTRKTEGHYVYWLSKEQRRPVGTSDCRRDHEFEIKTDKSMGLCTLPGSAHKEDPNFRYTAVGIDDHIEGEEYLKLQNNHKLRPILELLRKDPHILIVGENPIVLKWQPDIKPLTTMSKEVLNDLNDVNDVDFSEPHQTNMKG